MKATTRDSLRAIVTTHFHRDCVPYMMDGLVAARQLIGGRYTFHNVVEFVACFATGYVPLAAANPMAYDYRSVLVLDSRGRDRAEWHRLLPDAGQRLRGLREFAELPIVVAGPGDARLAEGGTRVRMTAAPSRWHDRALTNSAEGQPPIHLRVDRRAQRERTERYMVRVRSGRQASRGDRRSSRSRSPRRRRHSRSRSRERRPTYQN